MKNNEFGYDDHRTSRKRRGCNLNVWLLLAWSMLIVTNLTACNRNSNPKTEAQKEGYAVGVQLGKQLQGQKIEFDADMVNAGLKDVLLKKPLKLDEKEIQTALNAINANLQKELAARAEAEAAKSRQFLEMNAKASGVSVTSSGLQIQELRRGDGKAPVESSKVTVHYTATFVDGRVFDSSVDRGTPQTFVIKESLPGLREALLQMRPGARRRVVMPPELGYGPRGRDPIVPPNAALVYDLELIKVE